MSDPRSTPDPALVDGQRPAQVAVPLAELLRSPRGPRDRQLVMGEPVTILGATGAHSYVMADRDGYVGFMATETLGTRSAPTHRVTARATHVYDRPDIKSRDRMTLSFGSRLTARAETAAFVETPLGHVPKAHLAPADQVDTDPVAIAEILLGTPYLWGGNSAWGIDCSGLVQAALLTCGIPCPGDSDQQAAAFGDPLPPDAPYRRGDLLFWKGHVAMVLDAATLIHANAHHMTTTIENTAAAIARIAQAGDGPVTAHKRPATGAS